MIPSLVDTWISAFLGWWDNDGCKSAIMHPEKIPSRGRGGGLRWPADLLFKTETKHLQIMMFTQNFRPQ